MDWYVSRDGQTVGPMSEEAVRDSINRGHVTVGAHVRDAEGGAWAPIEQSPFGSLLAGGSSKHAPNSGSDAMGQLIVLVPILGAVLTWMRISGMSLLERPGAALQFYSFALVALTAMLVFVDASQLGFGAQRTDGKRDSGPVAWAFATLLLFAVALPWYLTKRAAYGARRHLAGGLLAVVVAGLSFVMLSAHVEAQQDRVRSAFSP